MRTFSQIRDEVCVENMMETVTAIAQWERLSGSQEELQAFLYLKKRLEDYGYETQLHQLDAYISLPLSCTLTVNGTAVYAQTHSMVPTAQAKAPMVFCEKGHVEETDCRGKIVLTYGRAEYEPVKAAQDRGAVGMVFIQDAIIRECIPSACWGSPTTSEWDLLPDIPVASVVDDQGGDALAAQLKEGQTLIADLSTVTDSGWRKIPLLMGEVAAPVPTRQFVQLSGHLDSWYYGAVDNGTSNALQLEIARLVQVHRQDLKRNFRIVYFSGHSHGRYAGSARYVDEFWEDLHENCVVNINSDSAGCKGAEDLTRSIIMPETKDLAVQIVKEQTGVDFQGVRCARLGDQSFWNVGISSAFASFSRQKKVLLPNGTMGYPRGMAELGEGWHTPNDTLDKIDPDNLRRDAKIVGEYTLTFLTEPVLPLHFQRSAQDITRHLENWNAMAGEDFDLGPAIARSLKLQEACKAFDEANLSDSVRNDTLVKLGRILVLLNFCRGNPYGTEPATDIDPMPCLTPIRRLADKQTPQQERMALRLEVLRASNFINHSLIRAIRLIESVL